MKKDTSQRDITNKLTRDVITAINMKPNAFVFRVNTLGVPLPGGGFRSGSISGISDILGTINTHSVYIEIKTGKDRQRAAQKAFQKNVEDAGAIYFVFSKIEDVKLIEDLWTQKRDYNL